MPTTPGGILAGYIMAGEYDRAAQTWGKLLHAIPSSGLTSDTLYWQGRALERAGRQSEARTRYERLRTSYRQTLYGYLARARLEGRSAWAWEAKQFNGSARMLSSTLAIPDALPTDDSNPHAMRGRNCGPCVYSLALAKNSRRPRRKA